MARASAGNDGVPTAYSTSVKCCRASAAAAGASPSTLASYVLSATVATIAVTSTMPIRLPTASEASLSAAAVAGRPRGTLAKMIAVRTVVRRRTRRR